MRHTFATISVCLLLVSGCSPTEKAPAMADANAAGPARELTTDEKCDLIAETLARRSGAEAGIYTVTDDGQVEKMPIDVDYVELVSQNNENTSFTVKLRTSPFDSDLAGRVYLYLDGRAYHIPFVMGDVIGGESIYNTMRPSFRNENVYDALVEAFEVKEQLRENPGHVFTARLLSEKESYAPGEPPVVRLQITNTGDVTVGLSPGMWDLTATRDGEDVPPPQDFRNDAVTGDFNLDGLINVTDLSIDWGVILGPDETHEIARSMEREFDFGEPGIYRIEAICHMEVEAVGDEEQDDGNVRLPWADQVSGSAEIVVRAEE